MENEVYGFRSGIEFILNELLRIKLGENEDLKRDIDQYLAQTQTSGRKVIYEDRGRDWLTTVRKIMLFFY